MVIGESQLQLPLYSQVDQPPGTKGGALVPGVSTSQEDPLYSRVDQPPGTKGRAAVFAARPNALYSRVMGTPGTKAQTFSPGCNNSPGLKIL